VPAVPEDIQQQYDGLQHCLYVLRRAHLEGEPDEPVKALASTKLVDMLDVSFEDPMIASVGIGPWLHYMEVIYTLECVLLYTLERILESNLQILQIQYMEVMYTLECILLCTMECILKLNLQILQIRYMEVDVVQ